MQNFIGDVSKYTAEAADLAPTILPKLDALSDMWKQLPMSTEDVKAIRAPIFEGTLIWTRDADGKAVKLDDHNNEQRDSTAKLNADIDKRNAARRNKFGSFTIAQKKSESLAKNLVQEATMKMWLGLPNDQFEQIITNKFVNEVMFIEDAIPEPEDGRGGIVWEDQELKTIFNLNDKQIGIYKEFRAAIDKSLTNLAISDMVKIAGKEGYENAKVAGSTNLTYHQWVQVTTPNFKAWWGSDWEKGNEHENKRDVGQSNSRAGEKNSEGENSNIDGGREDLGRTASIHAIPSDGFTSIHPDTGEPRVFYHGTRDNFTSFDINHANKKDAGWLGKAHYVTSDKFTAESYSRMKQGEVMPQVMELYVRPINPMFLTRKDKQEIRYYTPGGLAKFTQFVRDSGHSGTAMMFEDGDFELAAFDANSIKSATGFHEEPKK